MLYRVEDAAGALAEAVRGTIRWRSVMDEAAERDFAVSIELPPGSALTRMALARGRREARAIADFRSPEGAARWLERAG
jgi:malonyl CoA-acyl carrier protein transacylase